MKREGRKCWLCDIDMVDVLEVVHIIDAAVPLDLVSPSVLMSLDAEAGSANDEQFERWTEMGILSKNIHPASAENLILLCLTCHKLFDGTYPRWILLPKDLDLFIKFEEKDYAERVAAAEEGVRQERSQPEVPFSFPLLMSFIIPICLRFLHMVDR
jgi:hypothetical protein